MIKNRCFNARYYDPESKRFLTEDPIQQGMNWYTYCGNDPVNYTDPDGMREVLDDKGDVVAVGGRAVNTRTGDAIDTKTGSSREREKTIRDREERAWIQEQRSELDRAVQSGPQTPSSGEPNLNMGGIWDRDFGQIAIGSLEVLGAFGLFIGTPFIADAAIASSLVTAPQTTQNVARQMAEMVRSAYTLGFALLADGGNRIRSGYTNSEPRFVIKDILSPTTSDTGLGDFTSFSYSW